MSDVTVTTESPAPGNTTEARLPDGTLKDQSTTTPTPEPKNEEGKSFLTAEPKVEDKPAAPKEGETPKPEDKPKPEAAAGAPEKYEDFKLPDGLALDKTIVESATAVFKELNLPQEGAQKLIDFYSKNLAEAATAPYKAWADTQREWQTEITSRFGDKADGVRADINTAIKTALPPSLATSLGKALDITGAGSHPDIVEALSILLRPHFEAKPVLGGKPSPEGQKAPGQAPPSIADAMYPHLRK